MAYLDEHKVLSDRQHTFLKKHTCETQLITVINDWAKILGKGGKVDTFIFDFEKAFDTPSCLVVNPIKVNNFAYLFDCTTVGRFSFLLFQTE